MLKRVYLDHNATTPLLPPVREAMLPFLDEQFGNPSSLHGFGREARAAVEEARSEVARLIGASHEEVYFTGGGSEADSLALIGLSAAHGRARRHLVTSQAEHPAVLESCRYLEKQGFRVTYLPVGRQGVILLEELERALSEESLLVSIMHVNNEVGTIQPVAEVVEMAHRCGAYVHSDAVQSAGRIPCRIEELGVDLLSLSAHKINGPKGVGALYVRRGIHIDPILHGGAQERGMRAGTEDVASIVGFGVACLLAAQELGDRGARCARLRDRLEEGILHAIPAVRLNGHPDRRAPGTLNVSFCGADAEALLVNLDLRGIAVSTGSACSSGSIEPSHVLLAMGLRGEELQGSIRFSLGTTSTDEDVDYVLEQLPLAVEQVRAVSADRVPG